MGLSMPSPPSAILLPSIRVSGIHIHPAIYYVTSQHLNCSRVMLNVSTVSAVARKQGGECEAGDRVGHAQTGLGEDSEETRHLQSKGSFHVYIFFYFPRSCFYFHLFIMEPISLGRTEFSGL